MKQAPKLELVTPPAVEPVTAADLASFLGASAADPLLGGVATGARDLCERHLGVALITQTWKQYFDLATRAGEWWDGVREGPTTQPFCLPETFKLARWPLNSVSSVAFYDELDAETIAEVASYYVSKQARPPAVMLRPSYSWPSVVYRVADAVIIQFIAGFGDAASNVPDALKNGIKALAAYMYEHRGECEAQEAIIKSGAAGYWKPYRVEKT